MTEETYPDYNLPADVASKIYDALTDMEEKGEVFSNGKTCVYWGIVAMIREHTGKKL